MDRPIKEALMFYNQDEQNANDEFHTSQFKPKLFSLGKLVDSSKTMLDTKQTLQAWESGEDGIPSQDSMWGNTSYQPVPVPIQAPQTDIVTGNMAKLAVEIEAKRAQSRLNVEETKQKEEIKSDTKLKTFERMESLKADIRELEENRNYTLRFNCDGTPCVQIQLLHKKTLMEKIVANIRKCDAVLYTSATVDPNDPIKSIMRIVFQIMRESDVKEIWIDHTDLNTRKLMKKFQAQGVSFPHNLRRNLEYMELFVSELARQSQKISVPRHRGFIISGSAQELSIHYVGEGELLWKDLIMRIRGR